MFAASKPAGEPHLPICEQSVTKAVTSHDFAMFCQNHVICAKHSKEGIIQEHRFEGSRQNALTAQGSVLKVQYVFTVMPRWSFSGKAWVAASQNSMGRIPSSKDKSPRDLLHLCQRICLNPIKAGLRIREGMARQHHCRGSRRSLYNPSPWY